jgi:hypothetical protein
MQGSARFLRKESEEFERLKHGETLREGSDAITSTAITVVTRQFFRVAPVIAAESRFLRGELVGYM